MEDTPYQSARRYTQSDKVVEDTPYQSARRYTQSDKVVEDTPYQSARRYTQSDKVPECHPTCTPPFDTLGQLYSAFGKKIVDKTAA